MAEDIAPEVIKIIRKKMRVEKETVTVNDKLTDLGLESIDALELVFDLEEKFDIEIPVNANEGEMGGLVTVGDVVKRIQEMIDKKKAAQA